MARSLRGDRSGVGAALGALLVVPTVGLLSIGAPRATAVAVVPVGQPPVTAVDGSVSPATTTTAPVSTLPPVPSSTVAPDPANTIPIGPIGTPPSPPAPPASPGPVGVNDPASTLPSSVPSSVAPIQAGVGTIPPTQPTQPTPTTPSIPPTPPSGTPAESVPPATSLPNAASTPPAPVTVARNAAELRSAVVAALGASTSKSKSVVVVLDGAGAVVELDPDVPRTPASTQKVYVAGAILARLGSDHRFTTEARGTTVVDGAGVVAELAVRASGDPSFSASQLSTLADAVAKSGVKRISGGLILDDSRFDTKTRIDLWKPSFTPGEVGVLNAFTIDQNRRFDKETANDPGLANLRRFRSALEAKGISVGAGSRRGLVRDGGPVFGTVQSAPLRELVRTMLKKSDNTYAEMLTKELGAQNGNGSTAGGVAVIGAHMVALGATAPPAQFDGSGLSSQNRSTARQQVEFLRRSAAAPYAVDFVGGLPVACVDGTLKNRLCKTSGAQRIQAKTGALNFVVGLAGYGTTANGRKVTFSFLLNDVRSANSARICIDRALAAISASNIS
jgi:serine-type D-Ala-D-Ala carboxypeptidase/endopeptidase (penicillin-binding protein 4)